MGRIRHCAVETTRRQTQDQSPKDENFERVRVRLKLENYDAKQSEQTKGEVGS